MLQMSREEMNKISDLFQQHRSSVFRSYYSDALSCDRSSNPTCFIIHRAQQSRVPISMGHHHFHEVKKRRLQHQRIVAFQLFVVSGPTN